MQSVWLNKTNMTAMRLMSGRAARATRANGSPNLSDRTNADISIWVDGVLNGTISKEKHLVIPVKSGGARVRVVLKRRDAKRPADAKMHLIAIDVDKSFVDCMAHKVCLDMLGNGTDSEYDLRNKNEFQKDCLEDDIDKHSSTDVQETCERWKNCLTEDMQTTLLAFLRAAIPSKDKGSSRRRRRKSESLLQISAAGDINAEGKQLMRRGYDGKRIFHDPHSASGEITPHEISVQDVDPNSCIDPASDDPESWYCECLPEMITACGDEADEDCFPWPLLRSCRRVPALER